MSASEALYRQPSRVIETMSPRVDPTLGGMVSNRQKNALQRQASETFLENPKRKLREKISYCVKIGITPNPTPTTLGHQFK